MIKTIVENAYGMSDAFFFISDWLGNEEDSRKTKHWDRVQTISSLEGLEFAHNLAMLSSRKGKCIHKNALSGWTQQEQD